MSSPDWQSYTAPDNSFSFEAPGAAQVCEDCQDDIHHFMTPIVLGQPVYHLSWFELSEQAKQVDPELAAQEFMRGYARGASAVIGEQKSQAGPDPAQVVLVGMPDGKKRGLMSWVTASRAYQMEVMVPETYQGDNPNPSISRFMNSIKVA